MYKKLNNNKKKGKKKSYIITKKIMHVITWESATFSRFTKREKEITMFSYLLEPRTSLIIGNISP